MLTPVHDRVIVRPLDGDAKTSGGIHIPQSAEQGIRKGLVLFVGPGAPDPTGGVRPMQIRSGDVILYGKFSGNTVNIPGEERPVVIMREDDVFAVVNKT